MDECTCRNKGTQRASPSTQSWTPRVLFSASRISILADSLTRPVSIQAILQGFLGTLNSSGLPSYQILISCQRSWAPQTSLVSGFRPAGFLSSIPRSAPTFLSLTLTLGDPSPRPSVNTHFSLQTRHFPGVLSFQRPPTTQFSYRTTLPQLLERTRPWFQSQA